MLKSINIDSHLGNSRPDGLTTNIWSRSNSTYNSNTFEIDPQSDILPIQQDSGKLPGAHKNLIVYNIGRTMVYAKLKYGTKLMWHGVTDTAAIQPGEKKVLDNGGKPYYVTGLKVYNTTNTRAVVHCATADDMYYLSADKKPGTFDEDRNKILKAMLTVGLNKIPYLGSAMSGLVQAFWPKNEPSVWDQIQDKLKFIIDDELLHAISAVLSRDLRYYQERITTLSEKIDKRGNPEDLRTHYMNIVQDMIGFENKFKFSSYSINVCQIVNQYVLPHFSAFVLMKVSFYVFGIRNSETLGLTDENIKHIKSYGNKTVYGDNGANKYINDLFKDRVDHAYGTWFAEDLYDEMMNVRSYISTQGLEYIRLWNHMLDNPFSAETNPYSDIISYSTFYGRQTANLIHEATRTELAQPLTPNLINGKRNKVTSIDFYIWMKNQDQGPPKIGGQKINFENGESYITGTETASIQTIQFNGATLRKLEVYGRGELDLLVFHFSDGRTETCGTKEYHGNYTVFELKDHHIVSLFISSDNFSLWGQAANISVAYKLNDD